MKKFTFTMIFVALTVVVFGQTVQNAKSAQEAGVVSVSHDVISPKSNVLTEGFESFVIPGTMNGWTRTQTNANVTWDTSTYDPYAGSRNVHCEYDGVSSTPQLQDEWLITPSIDLSSATNVTVSFAWNGSKYWSLFPYDNCDLLLKYSIDGGSTWSSSVWSELTDDTSLFVNWTWAVANVNVLAAAGQSNVKFALNYYGTDGAEFSVDEFKVDMNTGSGITPVTLTPVKIDVYPNPASENLNVESNFAIQNIRIFNDYGQLVMEQAIEGKSVILNISELPKGLYFVEIKGENGMVTKKITVNK